MTSCQEVGSGGSTRQSLMKPVRVQRKRTKGWRMPPNTVYVGRPSRWGNPFKDMKYAYDRYKLVAEYSLRNYGQGPNPTEYIDTVRKHLRGKNLACWCPLRDKYGKIVPCHADILLKIANE